MDTIYSYDEANIGIKHNGNRTLMYSRVSGQYILISRECFEILDEMIKGKVDIESVCTEYTPEDSEYLKSLCAIMVDKNIIYDINKPKTLQQSSIKSVYIYY